MKNDEKPLKSPFSNYFFGKYPKMPNYLFGKYPKTVLDYHDSEAENAIRHVQICPLYAISRIK
ncbi:hypothetical protein [Fibrobacter sp. UBA4309]|uniref:hypothetical protein n=1 Tax=Fibrobacter sp. UBA4309 TaxID=1946537 RepID=UPI0025BB370D|nr:hypothetical protein [Fibrobacter sp. UBA4309]